MKIEITREIDPKTGKESVTLYIVCIERLTPAIAQVFCNELDCALTVAQAWMQKEQPIIKNAFTAKSDK